jgi:hypothetical protein
MTDNQGDPFATTRQYTTSSAIELTGIGHGERSVIGTAVHLTVTQGRATFSEEVLTLLARRRKREDTALETILITEEVADALFLRLPEGMQLVGIVAQKHWVGDSGGLDFPVISDVAEAISRIPENYLILLHPKRNQVLVEPSAEEMAAFQKEYQKPRVLLGSLHTPAMTQSGQIVDVWAQVRTLEEADIALENGADGIYIEDFSEIAPFESNPLEPLLTLAALVGGGDLAVGGPLEVEEALTLAVHCRLTWVLPEGAPVAEAIAYLNESIVEREAENEPITMPRLALWLVESGHEDAGDETFLHGETPLPSSWGLPPLRVFITSDEFRQERLADAVAIGAVGVIVAPSEILAVKDAIRAIE